jgi:hypothetical protein
MNKNFLTLSLKYHLAVLSDMVSLAVKVTMSVDPSFNEQMLNIFKYEGNKLIF